ncbi:hypothetical protein CHARACLAT_031135 [Characodon lateralis]|uniref:Uncharacterized protein n=1 Tax=Characodon lateralis TaxID=208331 RepID=A0ABU7EEM6_9TELE|nr:hypothetical protein [Characodon lateralis]
MSLETFWPQSIDNMGKPRRHRGKNDAAVVNCDLNQDGEGPSSPDAGRAAADLDPAMAKAFEIMMGNITKVIENKLSPLPETVRQHTEDINIIITRLHEAEARILALDSVLAYEARIGALEKQASLLSERADMNKNYSRHLNI